jgi:hypothetical protein
MTKASGRIVKVLVALAALAVLGFLFLRSVRESRSSPYTVERSALGPWTVGLGEAAGAGAAPGAPALVLRGPQALVHDLSGQIFKRAMESTSSPSEAAIPLVLRGEIDHAPGGRMTPDALVAAARGAGLEIAAPQPRCLGYRRASTQTSTAQVYFVLFDAPEIERFREHIRAFMTTGGGPGDYDPSALSPVMIIAASNSDFDRWLPLHADPRTDCIAPIAVR